MIRVPTGPVAEAAPRAALCLGFGPHQKEVDSNGSRMLYWYGRPCCYGRLVGDAMNIALLHFRVGETDGVSLEMEKWKTALEQVGHKVFLFSGSSHHGVYIPGLEFDNPRNKGIHERAFGGKLDSEGFLRRDIDVYAAEIKQALKTAIAEYDIQVLVANNVLSLGHNLAAGLAVTHAAGETGIQLMAHHHDFHWERERYAKPTCPYVSQLLRDYFPSVKQIAHHVVINSLARDALREHYGVEATIVPNVFDFQQTPWQADAYNQDFRQTLRLDEGDLVLLQATRVTKRKAIELAIRLAAYLGKRRAILEESLYRPGFGPASRIVLFLPGLIEAEPGYQEYLMDLADGLDVQLLWANPWVQDQRQTRDGKKQYSLWDCYTIADLVTYPSILEGWGNQLLEAVFAKKPVVLYEYPVYAQDISKFGFDVGSFGQTHQLNDEGYVQVSKQQMEAAGAAALRYLTDSAARQRAVDHNFAVGQEHLSYQALAKIVVPLFKHS